MNEPNQTPSSERTLAELMREYTEQRAAWMRQVGEEGGRFSNCTLRDWFAGQALTGIMTSDGRPDGDANKAQWAYEIADAMLKARGGVS